MTLKSFIFRDTIFVQTGYADLVAGLQPNLDKTLSKGHINKESTHLFYDSDLLIKKLNLARLPLTEVEVKNKPNDKGQLELKFKIVNFALYLFGFASLSIWYAFIVDIDGLRTKQGGGLTIPTVISIAIYFFLLIAYLIDLSKFKTEIRRLETTSKSK